MLLTRTSIRALLLSASVLLFAVSAWGEAPAPANERLRTLWRGQWVDYVEQGDYAITQGDIIMAHKEAARRWRVAAEMSLTMPGAATLIATGKALTIDSDLGLWKPAASGVVEIPYVFEAGNETTISAALAEVNRALKGVVQWVPRGAQVDYVAFNLVSPGSGACASALGRMGGRQTIIGEPACSAGVLIHEMGHAMGLLHVQQDVDPVPFVETRLDRITPARRSQSDQTFYSRTVDGYDYASIMHYSRLGFNAYPDPITMETKPPGIDIGARVSYSAADVDALVRLYGAPPVATTIVSHPAGLDVIVDGVQVTTPVSFNWPIGSVHRIWLPAGLQTLDGYPFGFGRWSHDASTTPSEQLTWQVMAGDGTLGTPTTGIMSTVLTANFVRLMNITATASAQTGGTVTVTPRARAWPGNPTLFPQYSVFNVRAVADAGYLSSFSWTGNALLFGGGQGLAPDASLLLANSPAQTIGATFFNGASIGVALVGNGMTDGMRVTVTAPGGAAASRLAPLVSRTTAGSWKYAVSSPQSFSESGRYVLDGMDGLDNAATGEVTMPASGARTVTVRAHREWAPFRQVVPGCAGSVTLSDSSPYVRHGAALTATVAPVFPTVFTGWSGTVSGTSNAVSTTVGDLLPEFVATFNSVATPLTLTSITPPNFGDDAATSTITLVGTGFTVETRVSINRVLVTPQFIDGNTLRLVLSRTQLPFVGRLPVYAYNALSVGCPVNSNSVALDVLPVGQKVGMKLTEYYNAALDYYFLTGRDGDKAALDTVAGWARTGNEIRVFARPNLKTLPLERHFFANIAKSATRGSHFFTVLPSDQTLLTSLNPTNAALNAKPFLEGVEGYAVPKTATNTCPVSTIPIYRAFKGAPRYVDDGNHRFSVSLAQHQNMVNTLGWSDDGIVFCGLQ